MGKCIVKIKGRAKATFIPDPNGTNKKVKVIDRSDMTVTYTSARERVLLAYQLAGVAQENPNATAVLQDGDGRDESKPRKLAGWVAEADALARSGQLPADTSAHPERNMTAADLAEARDHAAAVASGLSPDEAAAMAADDGDVEVIEVDAAPVTGVHGVAADDE